MRKSSIIQAKAIVEEITEAENKKYNISINSGAYTLIEYYNSEIFKKKLDLCKTPVTKIRAYLRDSRCYGYKTEIDGNLNIILFIRNEMYTSSQMTRGIYHECRHCFQAKDENYIGFLTVLEQYLIYTDHKIYSQYHDTFFVEIDANLYSSENSLEYLNKKGVLTEKDKEKYQLSIELDKCYLEGYNPMRTFHKFNSQIQEYIATLNYNNSWLKDI